MQEPCRSLVFPSAKKMAGDMRGFPGSWVGFRASFLRLILPQVDLQPPFFLPNHPLDRPRGIIPGTYQQTFGVVATQSVRRHHQMTNFVRGVSIFCRHLDRHQTNSPGCSNLKPPRLSSSDAGYEAHHLHRCLPSRWACSSPRLP